MAPMDLGSAGGPAEDMTVLDDGTLVVRARAGDRRALEELNRRYQRSREELVCGMARRFHVPAQDLADLKQLSYLWQNEIYRSCDPERARRGELPGLLRQVMVRRFLNYLRDRIRRGRLWPALVDVAMLDVCVPGGDGPTHAETGPYDATGDNPLREAEQNEALERLRRARDHLAPKDRRVVDLRGEGLSWADIGCRTSMTYNTVQNVKKRAFRQLRAELDPPPDGNVGPHPV